MYIQHVLQCVKCIHSFGKFSTIIHLEFFLTKKCKKRGKERKENNKYSHVPLENHSVNLYTLYGRTCKQQEKKLTLKA